MRCVPSSEEDHRGLAPNITGPMHLLNIRQIEKSSADTNNQVQIIIFAISEDQCHQLKVHKFAKDGSVLKLSAVYA
ncbi:hypothetical protein CEXT_279261 [Caerostris extrusa]|uniref:Uncharacterized protein n=1 Tax=Caerostris extrusa TaxID=172846 RepID=A0AAV4QFK7_CAEEX|nr:hypothetical protein CEXT_279261 [Caerostris extrusa]